MGKAVTKKDAEQMLENALEIGARMLISGAEIRRVEDSIFRICTAYGSERTEVFSITYTIVATISSKNFGIITQSRRIHGSAFNLQELKYLNNLSRNVCENLPDMDEVRRDLKQIHELPRYTNRQGMLIYALISSAFTLFFGGTLLDAVISAAIGVMIKAVEIPLKNMKMNRFLVSCLCSLAAAALAVMAARTGIGCSSDKISIGNVMILIPGLMFTNCIREMISDNFLSGLTRFGEAVLLSLSIALGFAAVSWL